MVDDFHPIGLIIWGYKAEWKKKDLATVLCQSSAIAHCAMVYCPVTSEVQAAPKGMDAKKCLEREHFWKTLWKTTLILLLLKSVLEIHILQM